VKGAEYVLFIEVQERSHKLQAQYPHPEEAQNTEEMAVLRQAGIDKQ
jgi:hypothetical protein